MSARANCSLNASLTEPERRLGTLNQMRVPIITIGCSFTAGLIGVVDMDILMAALIGVGLTFPFLAFFFILFMLFRAYVRTGSQANGI